MRTIEFDGKEYYVTNIVLRMIHAALRESDKNIKAQYDHQLKQNPGTVIMTEDVRYKESETRCSK